MRAWRLQRRIQSPLDGEGARRNGGRWNSKGVAVVYSSPTLSLATLELLVHLDPDLVPDDLSSYEIDIPDDLLHDRIDPDELRGDWREPENPQCKAIGDAWIAEARVPLLHVPSVIIPAEYNVLINPLHPDARRITVTTVADYVFDSRLLG